MLANFPTTIPFTDGNINYCLSVDCIGDKWVLTCETKHIWLDRRWRINEFEMNCDQHTSYVRHFLADTLNGHRHTSSSLQNDGNISSFESYNMYDIICYVWSWITIDETVNRRRFSVSCSAYGNGKTNNEFVIIFEQF